MTPTLSAHEQALVLLCSRLALSGRGAAPLKADEWSKLREELSKRGTTDASALIGLAPEQLASRGVAEPLAERVADLLARGTALAIELERLQSRGVWVATRDGEVGYPKRWIEKLGSRAPVVVCGAGDASLLGTAAATVVGSRDVDDEGSFFAATVGARLAEIGWAVVSGGARGVDRAAVDGALEGGGKAVEVLADGFEKALRDVERRRHVEAGRLCVVTAFHPSQPFSVDVVMARNRLLYTLGRVAFVAASEEGRGGTWAGAVENLKAGWVPLFVRDGAQVPRGNGALIERGAKAVTLQSLPRGDALAHWLDDPARPLPEPRVLTVREPRPEWSAGEGHVAPVPTPSAEPTVPEPAGAVDVYTLVLPRLMDFCERPRAEREIKDRFVLEASQLKKWLKRAVAGQHLRKLSRPVRYQTEHSMFD
jgi:predicted Rossmann fold nucleotide-binding protein DprA/Smf involved in DNA uptake